MVQVEVAILDAAEERRPRAGAEDEGESVGWWLCRTATRPVPSGSAPASTQLPPPFSL